MNSRIPLIKMVGLLSQTHLVIVWLGSQPLWLEDGRNSSNYQGA